MPALTHVLFDFFGTLVTYSESWVEQGFERSHELVLAAGARVSYSDFLERWAETFEELENSAQDSLDEYSMNAVSEAFLQRLLPRPPAIDIAAGFRDMYLKEWNSGVGYIPGVPALLADLAERFTLVLVTNTHHADLVQSHLREMDAARHFATVVTSVEHGRRKPSPCIFECALARSGADPGTSVHVGDSYSADYLGASAAGLRCLLIDPEHRHDVPASDRLMDVFDVRARLAG